MDGHLTLAQLSRICKVNKNTLFSLISRGFYSDVKSFDGNGKEYWVDTIKIAMGVLYSQLSSIWKAPRPVSCNIPKGIPKALEIWKVYPEKEVVFSVNRGEKETTASIGLFSDWPMIDGKPKPIVSIIKDKEGETGTFYVSLIWLLDSIQELLKNGISDKEPFAFDLLAKAFKAA